jgi:hypothetical protein
MLQRALPAAHGVIVFSSTVVRISAMIVNAPQHFAEKNLFLIQVNFTRPMR